MLTEIEVATAGGGRLSEEERARLYALVGPDDARPLRVAPRRKIDPGVRMKPGYRWLPYRSEPRSNDRGKVVDGPLYRIDVDGVVEYWQMRDFTPQEIDADLTQRAESASQGLNYKLLYNLFNRVQVLEGKQPIGWEDFKTGIVREALRAPE